MIKNYALQGMSCGGCVSNVKKVLLQFPGVEDAEVHLHPQSVVLTLSKAIPVDELQTQLTRAGDYKIKEMVSIQ